MIMRITWGKLRAGTWAEYEQAYHATVAGKTVPGLRGRWLAQDVNDADGGFSVSLWDSLDAMQGLQALLASCHAGHDANHPKYRIIPSKVGERIWGNDFMRHSLA
jgi:heme-degrading monooxygenase HmoA